MGDFNYVANRRDRFSNVETDSAAPGERSDEDSFNRLLADPAGFCEIDQEEFTHDSALGRSRLDRIYSNHYLTDQLDRRIGCAALSWVPWLSAHRPVAFFRQKPAKHGGSNSNIRLPTAPMNDPEWPQRVALQFGELQRGDDADDQPLRRLVLIKRAIVEVTRRMQVEAAHLRAESSDDKLGWAMRYVRAAEDIRMGAMRKCVAAYPHLATLANPDNPNVRVGAGLDKVRQHALELARTAVLDDLRKLHANSQLWDDMQRARCRDSIQTKLRRLVPGGTTTLKAMRTAAGAVTTDPREMAAALCDHWGDTFASKPVAQVRLAEWLHEVFPDGGNSRTVAGLPEHGANDWNVQRADIEDAINKSGDTMAGPDGIPYAAWRALGPLGVDILFEAAETLSTEQGIQKLLDAGDGEG